MPFTFHHSHFSTSSKCKRLSVFSFNLYHHTYSCRSADKPPFPSSLLPILELVSYNCFRCRILLCSAVSEGFTHLWRNMAAINCFSLLAHKCCMKYLSTAIAFIALSTFTFIPPVIAVTVPPAFQESISTPHWRWEGRNAAGTVRALFITQSYAVRDPDELAQRFDIEVTTLGVPGQPPNGIKVDNNHLASLLTNEYHAVVITPYYARDIFDQISPENRATILNFVRRGGTLVISRGYGSWPAPKPSVKTSDDLLGDLLSGEIDKPEVVDDGRLNLGSLDHDTGSPQITLSSEMTRALPPVQVHGSKGVRRTHGPSYRGGLSMATLPLGKGKVVYLFGVGGHWTSFNALLGEDIAWPTHSNPGAFFDDPVAPELHFAIVARWLRKTTSMEADLTVRTVSVETDPAPLDTPNSLRLTFSKATTEGLSLCWMLYSPQADLLASNTVPVASGVFDADVSFMPSKVGPLVCQWRLEQAGTTLDSGAAAFVATAPVALASVSLPTAPAPNTPLALSWQLTAAADETHHIILQLYDPKGNIVAMADTPAHAGETTLAPWPIRYTTYTLRTLLLADGRAIDEQRQPVTCLLDRATDTDEYLVAAWAMEGGLGTWQGRYRSAILNRLGIMALSGNGGAPFYRMIGEAAMRPTLCNIFHPAARSRPGYDATKAHANLLHKAEEAAPHSPVGYMFGDEPGNMGDVIEYSSQAAATIRQADPTARVGWSGVWLDFKQDVPEFFKTCNYVTAYSPHHLYTPNLWLGVERDLYRSFKQPDSILTCWTHYAPWADNEPYSRTVPWLWLFEGMNGVSYFSTADEFAILPGDLRLTHETRWWNEELRELKHGAGKQLIGMERDNGGIRILFTRYAGGSETWMRALNQLNIPYRLFDRDELVTNPDQHVKLVICPEPQHLSEKESAALQACAAAGGIVVAVGPALTNSNSRLEALFGLTRPADNPPLQTTANINSTVSLRLPADQQAPPLTLSGKTTGECRLAPGSGHAIATFSRLGDKTPESNLEHLDFLSPLFETPAAIAKQHGSGLALYLNFHPDLAAAKNLITNLVAQTSLPPPVAQITCNATPADTIYLYPFKNGPVTMLGVVQDYWRVPPQWNVAAENGNTHAGQTALYYYHGPSIWAEHPAQIKLATAAHLYNARTGLYYGRVEQAQFQLQAGRPDLFALLPYRVEELKLTLPTTATPGELVNIGVELFTDGPAAGRHVVNVTLTHDSAPHPAESRNVELLNGKATLTLQLPYNTPSGVWKALARDAVSGQYTTKTLSVVSTTPIAGGVLHPKHPVSTLTALPWPQGRLVSHAEAKQQREASQSDKVSVSGATLTPYALPQHWGKYANQKGLKANFTLRNPLAYYQMRYEVCNDWEANGWEKGRIWANARPGLGIHRPNPMAWYYNGYLEIWLDDLCAANYAATSITDSSANGNGQVDMAFTTPSGDVTLSFAMMPDHIGLFQQLEIRPSKPLRNVKVMFRRYEWADQPHRFIEIDPEEQSWALTGDRHADRALGKGRGPAAMLVEPAAWDKVSFTPPHPTLQKTINLQAGETFKTGWVLWLFPDHGNEQAHNYLRDNSAATRQRLAELINSAWQ